MTTQTKYRRYDSESDYYAMGYRMYSAEFGRFLAVDPLFEAMPRHNPYHYSFNSPMCWSDPSGLVPVKEKVKNSEKLQMVEIDWGRIKEDNEAWAAIASIIDQINIQNYQNATATSTKGVFAFFGKNLNVIMFGGGGGSGGTSTENTRTGTEGDGVNSGFIVDNMGNVVGYNSDVNDCGIYQTDDEGNLTYLGEIGGALSTEEIIDNILKANINFSKSKNWQDIAEFIDKVKGGRDWDYKDNLLTMFGLLHGTGTLFAINGYGYMNSEDFGNFHFGIVANAWGFSLSFSTWGAGMYQIYSNTSPFIRRIPFIAGLLNGTSIGYIFIPPYGDDPWDHMRIIQGFNYYNSRYGE